MKKTLLYGLIFLFLSLLPSSLALAQGRIGFIDMREVMTSSEQGKRAADEFRKAFEREREIIQAREAELKRLRDDLDKQRPILTEAAIRDREAAYQRKFRDYQSLVRDANEALQQRDQELTKMLMPEILKVINAVGEKEKFAMIIDISTVPLPFFARELDMTKRIIDELNKITKPVRK